MITKVLSVGGSIIAPDKPDGMFLAEFSKMASDWLIGNGETRLILVAGGGGPARAYQNAYKDVEQKSPKTESRGEIVVTFKGEGEDVNDEIANRIITLIERGERGVFLFFCEGRKGH